MDKVTKMINNKVSLNEFESMKRNYGVILKKIQGDVACKLNSEEMFTLERRMVEVLGMTFASKIENEKDHINLKKQILKLSL